MPEYRRDPITGSWIILARERGERPSEYVYQPQRRHVNVCPFCSGNEHLTPGTLVTFPPPDETLSSQRSWDVRVIPNKYPAVSDRVASPEANHDWLVPQPGYGVHEVIIESSQHTASFTELTDAQAYWSLVAYRDRLQHASRNAQLRFALLFKNCRGGAGATLEHTHSQLLATAWIPAAIAQELKASEEHWRSNRRCLFCTLADREFAAQERVIAETEGFRAWCPFGSRFPYEVWILPREHQADFTSVKLENLAELSWLFQRVLRALEKTIPQAPYNYWIHTAPFDSLSYDHYHWHIELIPRITTQAGFEWGAGCFVNPVAPEAAAAELRAAFAETE